MEKIKVYQETEFVCDKCGASKMVKTELEEYDGEYSPVSEFTPEGFYEVDDLEKLLCKQCKAELDEWFKNKV